MTMESPVLVLNAHPSLMQPAEFQRSEVGILDAVVDLLQADVFTDVDDRHVHQAADPPNTAHASI
jgi:hypothetical protein